MSQHLTETGGPKRKVFLISLGCAKNLVDSEHVLGLLTRGHFSIVQRIEDADFAFINTCGFIQSAVEESIEVILEVSRQKKTGSLKGLFVMGCLVQRYGYKLQREMPEVDGWVGTGETCRIVELLSEKKGNQWPSFLIGKPGFLADHEVPRIQATPFYTAYLKIAEGCFHGCSYCMIPRLRGPFRSRELASLVSEARQMVDRGVKEINLIAQDTTLYGADLGENTRLEDLLDSLLKIQGICWIRILYAHPHGISDRLLNLMDREEAICPYLDIPLQHVNRQILKAMGRASEEENPWQLIERIRSKTHRISLRTTVMVGFPGETDEMFGELYDFVDKTAFEHLGAFVFSPEKGTAAARLDGVVERGVAEERLGAIMKLQSRISQRKNQMLLGHILPVLIEGESPETTLLLKGRTATMAPDVDGQVLISKGYGSVGKITEVLITDAHPYDLVGEIV
jgi:ribosomal protein S12 methylthiotransferase